ncbi:F-box protein [Pyrus ussuriensis x Pyrus communis]|uniref:F-box protein n=1 Tax=Pyrus ussuriensis x Pyrus communis TaxID=2448454 RepID=A0A5N5FQ71_9ROSA|nr:F-box protein [Pyrus ussuriensis x Pyrus communis]
MIRDLLQTSVAQVENMASLNTDLSYEVLKRLDGPALASAACACAAFCSISREERLWEYVCSSKWPSTNREDVKSLILSIGGFRKFYADCFPPYCNEEVSEYRRNDYLEYPEEWTEAEHYGDMDEFESISPSDFGSLVDIRYKDKIIGSMFFGAFRIQMASMVIQIMTTMVKFSSPLLMDLPPIASMETEKRDGKLWRGLRDGLRLSWIVANRKIKQAANLACCYPLGGQRHWPTDKDFVMLFGSLLPAIGILPCQVVECILSLKLRVICTEGEGFEDMADNYFNGRNSLLICSRNSRVLSLVLKVQNELKEEKMRNESRLDRLCILTSIAALVSFCYYVL